MTSVTNRHNKLRASGKVAETAQTGKPITEAAIPDDRYAQPPNVGTRATRQHLQKPRTQGKKAASAHKKSGVNAQELWATRYQQIRPGLIQALKILLHGAPGQLSGQADDVKKAATDLIHDVAGLKHPSTGEYPFGSLRATIYVVWAHLEKDPHKAAALEQEALGYCTQQPRTELPIDLLYLGLDAAAQGWCEKLLQLDPQNAHDHLMHFGQAAYAQGEQSGEADAPPFRLAAWCAERLAERSAHAQERQEFLQAAAEAWLQIPSGAERALGSMDAILKIDPDNAFVRAHRPVAHWLQKDMDAANRSLASAMEYAGSAPCDHDALMPLLHTATQLMTAEGLDDVDATLRKLMAAIESSSATGAERAALLGALGTLCLTQPSGVSAAHNAFGIDCLMQARMPEPRGKKRQAGKPVPSKPAEICLLVHALQRADRAADAKQVLREALSVTPRDLSLRWALLALLQAMDTTTASELTECYQILLAADPDDGALLRQAAVHYEQIGLWDGATDTWRRLAEQQGPYALEAWLHVGCAAARAKRPQTRTWTMRALKKAWELQPDHVPTLLAFADVHSFQGHYGEALGRLQQAMAIAPHDVSIAAAAARAALNQVYGKKLPPVLHGEVMALHDQQRAAHDVEGHQAIVQRALALLSRPTSVEPALQAPVMVEAHPTPEAINDPLAVAGGSIIGVNFEDHAVVQKTDGRLVWSYDPDLARRWEDHRPAALDRIPSHQRHDLPVTLQQSLDATLQLIIVGQQTVGAYVTALSGPRDVCLLRGSRVYGPLLRHFMGEAWESQQQPHPDTDIDLGTSVAPAAAQRLCFALAPEHRGAHANGGIATPVAAQYHGTTGYHQGEGAKLSMDVTSFCTRNAYSPKQFVEGSFGKVYPKVFGSDLRAWSAVQDFAPLFYDFATKQIYDPTGLAWEAIQRGEMRIASKEALDNPTLPLRVAKLARFHLSLSKDDLSAVRAAADTLLAGKPRLAADVLGRFAPAGLPDADALMQWVTDTLHAQLMQMSLGHVYKTCFAPCSRRQVIDAYQVRHRHALGWT